VTASTTAGQGIGFGFGFSLGIGFNFGIGFSLGIGFSIGIGFGLRTTTSGATVIGTNGVFVTASIMAVIIAAAACIVASANADNPVRSAVTDTSGTQVPAVMVPSGPIVIRFISVPLSFHVENVTCRVTCRNLLSRLERVLNELLFKQSPCKHNAYAMN
jgi:hypothetical protein